ncbi:MAG TPA: S8 family serine peptidase [Solirubrobacterales bacterium]
MLASASCALALVAVPAQASTTAGGPAYRPGEVVVGLAGGGSEVAELPAGTSVAEGIAELRRAPGVRSAAPNWTARAAFTALDQGTSGTPGGWVDDQWSLRGRPGGIRVPGAWDRLLSLGKPGGFGVTVAVVDTGLAYEDAPGYAASPDFFATQFVPGIDLVDDDEQPLDENGHGTHVAGTIGEQVTVGQASPAPDYLTGVAYGASLMPVRVLDQDGVGSTDDVAAGILWAAKNGADVVNLSLNFDPAVTSCRQVPTVCAAIRKADKLGAIVIGSSGNALGGAGRKRSLFPAGAPRAFSVAATTENGCLAAYSYYGKRTDLVAPGGGAARPAAARPACTDDAVPILQLTYACFPMECTGGRQRFAIRPDVGTSMSAAHTSGVAALVIASGVAGPDPDPDRVALRLQCTARPATPERFYAAGLLDAQRAVDPARHCDAPG